MTETENTTKKGPVTKGKLRSVMEAASALTTLGENESESGGSAPSSPKTTPKESPKEDAKEAATKDAETPATSKEDKSEETGESPKRFLPDHKKPDAALTFPEKVSYCRSRAGQAQPQPLLSRPRSAVLCCAEQVKISFARRPQYCFYALTFLCRRPNQFRRVEFRDNAYLDKNLPRSSTVSKNMSHPRHLFVICSFAAHEVDGVCRC